MSGTIPTRLIFLSDLPTCAPGDKVRFLGCVERYDPVSGMAFLKHDYPASPTPAIARVQLDHVLESLTATSTQVGTWLNVIGTVGKVKRRSRHRNGYLSTVETAVGAVILWEAKTINLNEYEKTVEDRKDCNSTG